MSNSTLPFSILNCAVTIPDGTKMQEDMELAREEHQLHVMTSQALNTIKHSPRQSTLIAILDYAQTIKEER